MKVKILGDFKGLPCEVQVSRFLRKPVTVYVDDYGSMFRTDTGELIETKSRVGRAVYAELRRVALPKAKKARADAEAALSRAEELVRKPGPAPLN